MKGNNFHFIVKSLVSQRLIVRQSALIKVKDNGAEGEEVSHNKQVINTNSLYLSRYAKDMNMNSQQRIEITKPELLGSNEETNIALQEDGALAVNLKNDISVHDYLPAMEAICEKLENASGKVNCSLLFPFDTLFYLFLICTFANLGQLFRCRLSLCQI